MEGQYFKRTLKEGTVKRTHFCSFDKTIKLEMLIVRSKKVIDNLFRRQNSAFEQDEAKADKKAFELAKDSFMNKLEGLRINGLPVIYEDLIDSFDNEEIMEIMAFVNEGDMSIFEDEAKEVPEDEKNA